MRKALALIVSVVFCLALVGRVGADQIVIPFVRQVIITACSGGGGVTACEDMEGGGGAYLLTWAQSDDAPSFGTHTGTLNCTDKGLYALQYTLDDVLSDTFTLAADSSNVTLKFYYYVDLTNEDDNDLWNILFLQDLDGSNQDVKIHARYDANGSTGIRFGVKYREAGGEATVYTANYYTDAQWFEIGVVVDVDDATAANNAVTMTVYDGTTLSTCNHTDDPIQGDIDNMRIYCDDVTGGGGDDVIYVEYDILKLNASLTAVDDCSGTSP